MEKADRPSFLKSLALAFGDGILFGVAMKLAQGPSKSREEEMTELDPLAERLRKVEDHAQTIDKDGLTKFGEGLDGPPRLPVVHHDGVAGDDPGPLEPLDPPLDGRRREADLGCQLGQGDARVGAQAVDEPAVGFVEIHARIISPRLWSV